ncbi:MAG TPA: VOC family protein [Thermoanaerobaculia bacterium]|jgi:PhnB protein
MPTLAPYLSFDGNCSEAMRFYEKTLDGKLIALLRNADIPGACEALPPGNEERIMHAYLTVGEVVIMAGDSIVGWPYEGMKGFHLTLSYDDTERGRRIYDALADGGKVTMPWAPAFYAEGTGMLVDRYGTPWIVNGKLIDTMGGQQ